jgi:hypothetical protein
VNPRCAACSHQVKLIWFPCRPGAMESLNLLSYNDVALKLSAASRTPHSRAGGCAATCYLLPIFNWWQSLGGHSLALYPMGPVAVSRSGLRDSRSMACGQCRSGEVMWVTSRLLSNVSIEAAARDIQNDGI